MVSNEGIFTNIIDMFKTARNNRIERSNVITILNNLSNTLTDDFLDSMEMLNSSPDLVKRLDFKLLTKLLGTKDNMDTVRKLYDFFKDVVNCLETLKKDVYDELPPITTSKVVGVKSSMYLKLIDDLASMAEWYSGYLVTVVIDRNESKLPDAYFNKIGETMLTFVNMYKTYNGKLYEIIADIKKIENVNVDINDNNSTAVASTIVDSDNKGLLVLSQQGFIGNPIFSFRIWLVERSIKKLEKLEYENKIRQLALNELKAKLSGDLSPKVRESYLKQIANYENMITDALVKINKIKGVS